VVARRKRETQMFPERAGIIGHEMPALPRKQEPKGSLTNAEYRVKLN
jgi:hypothetical protein